jgi:hypothetical protein
MKAINQRNINTLIKTELIILRLKIPVKLILIYKKQIASVQQRNYEERLINVRKLHQNKNSVTAVLLNLIYHLLIKL